MSFGSEYSDSEGGFEPLTDSENGEATGRQSINNRRCKTCGDTHFDLQDSKLICRMCKTINNFGNNVSVGFETMMQAMKGRARVKKPKGKKGDLSTPTNLLNPTKSRTPVLLGETDWKHDLFNNVSPDAKNKEDEVKEITSPDNWVDDFLSVHFGLTVCAKQMRIALDLNLGFERIVKNLWVKYLSCWKNKPIIGCFTTDRRGGLQLDKRKQVKRFEFFTQKELEEYYETVKQFSEEERVSIENKEYRKLIQKAYYDLRYEKDKTRGKRRIKEVAKNSLNTIEFLKKATICYHDDFYNKFESPKDVFCLDKYPEMGVIERAMIYAQKKYPVDTLIDQFKLDPVKLLRSIKYKSGKLLNIEDRTYTTQVLTDIAGGIYLKLGVKPDFRLYKFMSTKIRKREKLLLLIFTLDMSFNEYLTATKGSSKHKPFDKWLKKLIINKLTEDYLRVASEEVDKEKVKLVAKKEVKKMSFEKRLSEYLSYHFKYIEEGPKTFREQIKDIKRSKYDNPTNKLTSIEPNTILNFLILGYFDYISKNKGSKVHSVCDIIDLVNENKVNYLNFGNKFVKSLKNPNMQVKHISSPLLVCRKLRYLMPQRLNYRVKDYFLDLCNKTCEDLNISGGFQALVVKYLYSQWKLLAKQASFPFNAKELILDCISRIYTFVYLSGLTNAQVNNLPLSSSEEGSENLKFQTKEEFDQSYSEGFYEKEKERTEKSIPWEVKNYEFCSLDSIPTVIDSTESHFTKSNSEGRTERNELADMFEDIMNFSEDEEPVPVEDKSDESSIMSSEDEDEEESEPYKIFEVEVSIS